MIRQNPYQRLLYEQLAAFGFGVVPDPHFKIGWLWRARRRVTFVHFHWPQGYYCLRGRTRGFKRILSWLKLALFAVRLAAARALGYRVVWTIHEVQPHERASGNLDRAGALALACFSHLLIAHDPGTVELACNRLGRWARKIEVVPHGSYIGIYQPGRPRERVRAELGIGQRSFTFLCFGHVRAYKALQLLLGAFMSASISDAVLLVAGMPMDAEAAAAIHEAASRDRRIKPLLEFIPDDRVAELYAACDAAVLARGDGGTSGALILALSLGLPVVAARSAAYEELAGGTEAGWLFTPGDGVSLRTCLEAAAADPQAARTKATAARRRAGSLSWPEIGERTAILFFGLGTRRPRSRG